MPRFPSRAKTKFSTSRRIDMPFFATLRRLKKSSVGRGVLLAGAAAVFVLATAAIGNAAVIVVHPIPRPVVRAGGWFGGPVRIAPPLPRMVVVPAPPPGWIWSAGYWNWSGSAYVWIDGVWLRERPGFGFVPAHWEHFPAGWHFISGGWVRRPL
jgi:hypothetical protein